MAKVSKKKGVPTNQGKMTSGGVNRTIDCGGHSDGGGSAEVAKVAKGINVGNRKGGLPGL